jgi:hypothetical protein
MSDKYDDLEKLADLKNKGIITEEEFNLKKARILSSDSKTTNTKPSQQEKDNHPQISNISTGYSKQEKEFNIKPLLIGFFILFIFFVVVCVINIFTDDSSKNKSQQDNITQSNTPEESKKDTPTLPDEENRFINQMKSFHKVYNDAPNEINKSEVFNQARSYEQQFFGSMGNVINNWKGNLTNISTSKGGDEVV